MKRDIGEVLPCDLDERPGAGNGGVGVEVVEEVLGEVEIYCCGVLLHDGTDEERGTVEVLCFESEGGGILGVEVECWVDEGGAGESLAVERGVDVV